MTKQENAAIEIIATVGQAIKELKSVPSGHLYVRLMGYMSLEEYNGIISVLVKNGLIKIENHLITWIG